VARFSSRPRCWPPGGRTPPGRTLTPTSVTRRSASPRSTSSSATGSGPRTVCSPCSSSSPGWNSNASSWPVTSATYAVRRSRRRRGQRGCRSGPRLRVAQPRRRRSPPRLGHPHCHRHRLRAGRSCGRRLASAVGPADLPAHPGGGRRPAGHHDHRGVLYEFTRHRAIVDRAPPARPLRTARPVAPPIVVSAGPVGRSNLGTCPCLRNPRHRRRVPGWESTSNTGCGGSPRVSRYRCSRSSRRAFGAGSPADEHVKVGVLIGSVSSPCSPRSCWPRATRPTADSARSRQRTPTMTGSPTCIRGPTRTAESSTKTDTPGA